MSPYLSMTVVHLQREHLDAGTHWGRSACENECTMWKAMLLQATECWRLSVNYQKPGDRHKADSLSKSSPETFTANTLILDFWPSELWDNTFLLFKWANLCWSPSKLIQDRGKECQKTPYNEQEGPHHEKVLSKNVNIFNIEESVLRVFLEKRTRNCWSLKIYAPKLAK